MRPRVVVALWLALTAVLAGALMAGRVAAGPATAAPVVTAAEPHILPFARELTGTWSGPAAGPTPVPIAEGFDGCDHAYGVLRQCVPWNFPTGAAGCAWLLARYLRALPVNGRDRHHLDTNHDGIACGPGDA
jgi:hypothetical protein